MIPATISHSGRGEVHSRNNWHSNSIRRVPVLRRDPVRGFAFACRERSWFGCASQHFSVVMRLPFSNRLFIVQRPVSSIPRSSRHKRTATSGFARWPRWHHQRRIGIALIVLDDCPYCTSAVMERGRSAPLPRRSSTKISSCSEARDRKSPANAHQSRLQNPTISRKIHPIRCRLPTGLGFR
jgi:hypothetical protein